MKLAIGCDHGGFELKEAVRGYLDQHQIPYEDFGCYSTDSVDYAPIAAKAAHCVANGEADYGILICSHGNWHFHGGEQGERHPGCAVHQ